MTADWVQIFFNYKTSDIHIIFLHCKLEGENKVLEAKRLMGNELRSREMLLQGSAGKINEIYWKLKINFLNLIWK